MTEKRYAVLIASSKYQDPNLHDLRFPENDVDGLNEVLSSEKHGNFTETLVLKNRPFNEVFKKINQVLKKAGKDDLVLIYYSGHGKLNRAGKLHLVTPDTEVELLDSTSIPIESIKNLIDVSASNKVSVILDSCFSGAAGAAFTKGEVDDQLQLASGGRGIYLMTSATGIQTALEKEGDQYGIFTKHIIEGINSGEADSDDDSLITMDELYNYVHDHVLEESHQEPTKHNLNVRGDLVIARSGKSKKEERANEIRKFLIEEARKGYLPDSILTKSLKILSSQPDHLTEKERRYDGLLDQFFKKTIDLGRFIDNWSKIEKEISYSEKLEKKSKNLTYKLPHKKKHFWNTSFGILAIAAIIIALLVLIYLMGGDPEIEYFKSEPAVINVGEETILKWSVSGAEEVWIEPGIRGLASIGTMSLKPAETITYILIAENSAGRASYKLTVEVRDPEKACAFIEKGNEFAIMGFYDEAIQAYEEAIGLDPDNPSAWIGKGDAFSDLKYYEEALEAYDEAISLDPNNAWTWIKKGHAFRDFNENEKALEAYDEAIKLDPENTGASYWAYYWKGEVLEALGRTSIADEAYARANELKDTPFIALPSL